MKTILGIMLIILPFLGLFLFIWSNNDLNTATMVFTLSIGALIAIMACITAGYYLITGHL